MSEKLELEQLPTAGGEQSPLSGVGDLRRLSAVPVDLSVEIGRARKFLYYGARRNCEAATDPGIGAEQRDRPKLPLGLVDHMLDVLFLGDVAFECVAADVVRDRARSGAIDVDHDHLRGARAMKHPICLITGDCIRQ